MKKQNSISEFTSERNASLLDNFRKNLAAQSRISINTAIKGAAQAPAPRFWVSEQRAAVVIGRMLRADHLIYGGRRNKCKDGDDPKRKDRLDLNVSCKGSEDILNEMYEEKREMYREIYQRVKELLANSPEMPVCDAVFEVVNQEAPRSYMSWQRAKGIIYSERRRRRLERSIR